LLVMEYVSKSSKRKDYEDNMVKYEHELKVLFYLLFYPEAQELTVFRHNRRKYVSVTPNEHGRLAIPALDLEVALLDAWVRFWYKGELLPLPVDLQHNLKAERLARQAAEARAVAAEAQAVAAEAQAAVDRQARLTAEQELQQLRAEVEQLKQRRNHK
jgi:hypothetical protein